MSQDDYQGAEGGRTYAPSYKPLRGQKDSSNGRGLLVLGVIVLLVLGLVFYGFYMAYQLTQSAPVVKAWDYLKTVNLNVVDDTDRPTDPNRPLDLPLRGKFMAVQLGAGLGERTFNRNKGDSKEMAHPRYYVTILDDKAEVVQAGRLPYSMEGILNHGGNSILPHQATDVLKQISNFSAVNPDNLKDINMDWSVKEIVDDGDMTYVAMLNDSRLDWSVDFLLAYNHKTGKAQYLVEIPLRIRAMTVHAGKIYLAGAQFSADDSKKGTTISYGAFAVLDQKTGKLENLLKYKKSTPFNVIKIMGDTPIMQTDKVASSSRELLAYKDGKLTNFHMFEKYVPTLVWADSEYVLCSYGMDKLIALDKSGRIVKSLNLTPDGGIHSALAEVKAQAQDGKVYLFTDAARNLRDEAVQITTVDLKTFVQEDETIVKLNEKGGDFLYGMLLPKQ